MSWIDDILEQHSELESPAAFWRWSALSSISAVLRDNVWLNKFAYKLYPNIYVMLHAESGLRKGPPVSMAKQLVKHVNNTKIISGRSSIQGILKELGTAKSLPGGKIESVSAAFICSSELSSSLVEDKAVIKILTDLFDRNYNIDDWDSLLKSEKFSIKAPVVSMLSATNEAMSEDFLTKTAIQGGLIARTFIINESVRQNINSLMFPLKTEINYEKSAEYLKELAKLRGEILIDEVDRKFYDEWYHEFTASRDSQEVIDVTGTLNRIDDAILKVAILNSLSEQPELRITRTALEKSIQICMELIGNVRRTTLGAGKSQWATEKALIIRLLIDREGHAISRKMLNKQYWMRASAEEWDEIMNQLSIAGIIEIMNIGNQVVFQMPDKIVEETRKHFGGK